MYDFEIIGAVRSKGSFEDRNKNKVINYDNINFYLGKPILPHDDILGGGFQLDPKSCVFKCKYNEEDFKDLFPKFDGSISDFPSLVGLRCEPYFDNYGRVKVIDFER